MSRPALKKGEKSDVLHMRLPASDHDDVCLMALRWEQNQRRRVSKADVIREAVRRLIASERGGFVSNL